MAYRTLYVDDGFGPFLVDDGTGIAYVDPTGAELVMKSGDEVAVGGGDDPPAHVREFLERETDVDPVGRRRRRYKEVRIGVGESVYVAGQADPEPFDGLDEPVTAAITERGDAPRFYVSDDPDTGLGRRLLGEALTSFVLAGILLAIAYFLAFS